jgi:hypothetical protein
MATETAVMERPSTPVTAEIMEHVIVGGDLAKLSALQRVAYYRRVCESLGLNPLTQPFQYITLNGKLTLYASRAATDQLRAIKGISVDRLEREVVEGAYNVTAYGHDRTGRTDSALGSVPIENLKGDNRSNAMMKAETKAKRRLTLSLAGLGWLDEVEVGSVPTAQAVEVDVETGEITAQPKPSLTESIAARRQQVETPIQADATAIAEEVFADAVVPEAGELAATSQAKGSSADQPIPEPATEPERKLVRCESRDPYFESEGEAEQCRLATGHTGTHRTKNASW